MVFREALMNCLKPSYWRFVYSLRAGLTLVILALPWFMNGYYHIGTIGDHFTITPIFLGIWTFSMHQKYLGGNLFKSGMSITMGIFSTAAAIIVYYIPHSQTILGGTIYILVSCILIELLVETKLFGLRRPIHIYVMIVIVEALFIGSKDVMGTLGFWLVLSVVLPVAMTLSATLLWPRTAIGQYYIDAVYVINQITVLLGITQKIAFELHDETNQESTSSHKTKVLNRLSEMEMLINEFIKPELWVGDKAPLYALRRVLSRGWFLVTVMKALVMDFNNQPSEVRPLFSEAFNTVYLQLAMLVGNLQRGGEGKLPADIITPDASNKLRKVVLEAYQITNNTSHWPVGLPASRFNIFLLCCLRLADYLEDLTEAVNNASMSQVVGKGGIKIGGNVLKNLGYQLKRQWVTSLFNAWPNFKASWKRGCWKAIIRNVLGITSSGSFALYWYRIAPRVDGFWICISVISMAVDNIGQNLVKGCCRLFGVFLAWAWAEILIHITISNIWVWIVFFFLFVCAMAYIQQDDYFGYIGQSGLFAYYVVCLGMYNTESLVDNTQYTMAMRALTVLIGVFWSYFFFIVFFPMDGIKDPLKKLHDASDLTFKAYELLSAHKDENVSVAIQKQCEDLLDKANRKHAAFEVGKLHTGVVYHLLGIVHREHEEKLVEVLDLARRIQSAIVAVRLLLLIGVKEVNRETIKGLGDSRKYISPLLILVEDCREYAINTPYHISSEIKMRKNLQSIHLESKKGSDVDIYFDPPERHPVASAAGDLLRAHFNSMRQFVSGQIFENDWQDLARWDAFTVTLARAARGLASIARPEEQYIDADLSEPVNCRYTTPYQNSKCKGSMHRSHSSHHNLHLGRMEMTIPRAFSERFVVPQTAQRKARASASITEDERGSDEGEESDGMNFRPISSFPSLPRRSDAGDGHSDWELGDIGSVELN